MSDVPLLRVNGITKAFGDVVANAGINFDLQEGEIHAVVGENGAGKSTLMHILYGMLRPDSGTIELSGEPVELKSPKDAISRGIGMVHQHFMLVPEFTVAQNVTLGAEVSNRGLVDEAATTEALARPMQLLGITFDAQRITSTLSVAQQQRLELLKLIYRGTRILILDEPTAVLTPQETDGLFATLKSMAAQGYSVIFISHKLREVMSLADRITILRAGRTTETHRADAVDLPTLVAGITGRTTVDMGRIDRRHATTYPVLRATMLSGRSGSDAAAVDVNFTIHRGEVLGIAGVDGNGQQSLVSLLTGLSRPLNGEIWLEKDEITRLTVAERRNLGLAHVPEDRHRDGLPLAGTVLEAMTGSQLAPRSGVRSLGPAFSRKTRRWAQGLVDQFTIKTRSVDARCSTLSGGNQQKIVIARELDGSPRVIVLAQPTRGVDIGAAEAVYAALGQATAAGAAALLVSADLDELMRVTDRIVVMYRGRIAAECITATTTHEALGQHMMGATAVKSA